MFLIMNGQIKEIKDEDCRSVGSPDNPSDIYYCNLMPHKMDGCGVYAELGVDLFETEIEAKQGLSRLKRQAFVDIHKETNLDEYPI